MDRNTPHEGNNSHRNRLGKSGQGAGDYEPIPGLDITNISPEEAVRQSGILEGSLWTAPEAITITSCGSMDY